MDPARPINIHPVPSSACAVLAREQAARTALLTKADLLSAHRVAGLHLAGPSHSGHSSHSLHRSSHSESHVLNMDGEEEEEEDEMEEEEDHTFEDLEPQAPADSYTEVPKLKPTEAQKIITHCVKWFRKEKKLGNLRISLNRDLERVKQSLGVSRSQIKSALIACGEEPMPPGTIERMKRQRSVLPFFSYFSPPCEQWLELTLFALCVSIVESCMQCCSHDFVIISSPIARSGAS